MGADGHFHQTDEEGTFVRAMYQKPTKFCDCGTATGLPFARKSSYTRSLKYGWMVHTQCKKPTTNWASGEGWYAALGTNLLPITGRAPEWRGVGIKGHTFDPGTKQWLNDETGAPLDLTKMYNNDKSKGL